jgi:hypothetical protein
MGGARSMDGRGKKKHPEFQSEILKGGDHLEDPNSRYRKKDIIRRVIEE